MSIKAVIWDLGGVLLRTEDQGPRQRLARELAISTEDLYHLVFDSPSARLATLGQLDVDQHWEAVRLSLGLAPEKLPALRSAFWEGDRLDYTLVNFIRRLRPRYHTVLLSNAWLDLQSNLEHEWGIQDAFDALVISSEVGMVKPGAEIFNLALARACAQPEEAVFVDDFLENVQAAKWMGLHTVHFRNPEQAKSELLTLFNRTEE